MDFLSGAFDFVSDIGSGLLGVIGSAISDAVSTLAGKGAFFILVDGLLSIVKAFWQLFSVFAGITKVTYGEDGDTDYLINVFFNNKEITNVYWAMALIGMAMVFLFTIIQVIRKMFDIEGKQRRSLSATLGSAFKGFLFIMLLSWFMTSVISASNVLLQQVTYIFDNAKYLTTKMEIEYSDHQFATMARVLNTVGNYSVNPSNTSRYNINSCFNEIRPDLYELQQQGVFAFPYDTKDENGNTTESWQSVLQKVVNSADLRRDLLMDVYYEGPTKALPELMETLQKNPGLQPLERYSWKYKGDGDVNVSIDRILFLMSTQSAAKNPEYNRNPMMTDPIRAPFYYGEKNMYSLSEVMEYFDIKIGVMSYVMLAIVAYFTLKNLWRCILQCIARIFSLLGLYVIAPPVIATMPMDEGEKFKQWMTAFIIQTFGIFGTVIPMRLLIMFVPMIFDSNLQIFPHPAPDMLAKVLLLIGGLEVTNSFGGMITGILANNAGMQAVASYNATNAKADSQFAVGAGVVGAGAKLAGGVAMGAAGVAANVTGLGTVGRALSKGAKGLAGLAGRGNEAMAQNGGLIGAIAMAAGNKFGGNKQPELPKNNANMRGNNNGQGNAGGNNGQR